MWTEKSEWWPLRSAAKQTPKLSEVLETPVPVKEPLPMSCAERQRVLHRWVESSQRFSVVFSSFCAGFVRINVPKLLQASQKFSDPFLSCEILLPFLQMFHEIVCPWDWGSPPLLGSSVCNVALFCSLLRSFVDLRLRSFALFYVFLCPAAFRMTAFGNFRPTPRQASVLRSLHWCCTAFLRLERFWHGPKPVWGGDFWQTFRAIGPYRLALKTRHQGICPYEFALKLIWTNGSQISLKLLVVYTGIGP